MTFLEALEEAKKGKKVRHNLWAPEVYLVIEKGNIKMCNTQITYLTKGYYTSNCWELYKESILDKTEKEYILNIIKPFKNRIISIAKKNFPLLFNQSFIKINIKYFNDTDIWHGTINSYFCDSRYVSKYESRL
nr:MAG TPA: Protein of unknown function (DUF2829) [Caudoviricetes sp.]